MSSSTSNQGLHPTNPILIKDVNTPKERGNTRVLLDGSLVYREPLTQTEVPAVRLEDIRPRLVREASTKKSYRFPKKRGYDDTNVTAFVKKDYNYGPKRENRPDLLFQIEKKGATGELPDGYVMDGGRVVLDAFDHGLRNFGNQLPMYVSSELDGQDIEHYLRSNRQISVYDLVARAPNGYYKGKPPTENKKSKGKKPLVWHEGPPRVGTFSMRATRFRMRAGLLSWEKKDGTVAKNQRILAVIPAQYKDPAVNSTKGWRDLNAAEIKKIKDGAKKKPQQGRKKNRAAKAMKGQEEEEEEASIDDPFEESDVPEDDEDELGSDDEEAERGIPNEQGSSEWPEYHPEDFERSKPARQMYNADHQSSDPWQSSSAMYEEPENIANDAFRPGPIHPRKRSESSLDTDSDEEISLRELKRRRTAASAQDRDREKASSHHTKPSRVARRQPLRFPTNPYVSRVASSPMVQLANGKSILGHEPLPLLPPDAFDFSSPVSHGYAGQLYNSSNPGNTGSLPSPGSYENNGVYGFGCSFPQSPFIQDAAYGSSGQPYLGNNFNSELEAHNGAVGDLFPGSGFHFNGSQEYESPAYEPQQSPNSQHPQAQHGAPFTQPVERGYPQRIPNPPETTGKRKRTDGSRTEHSEGQRPIKRAKGHSTQQAPAPDVWHPADSSPGAETYIPTTGSEILPPGYWPVDAPNVEFSPIGGELPELFPNLFPPNHGDLWDDGEGLPFEEQGHIPPINDQQGMHDHPATGHAEISPYVQAPDPSHLCQETQGSLDQNPPADFYFD